jgi:hypothetical protein
MHRESGSTIEGIKACWHKLRKYLNELGLLLTNSIISSFFLHFDHVTKVRDAKMSILFHLPTNSNCQSSKG